MKVGEVEMGNIDELARKAHKGLVNGIISHRKAGMSPTEIELIKLAIKNDFYRGNLFFYVCKKVREYFFAETEKELTKLKRYDPEAYEEKSSQITQERLNELPIHVSFCIEMDMVISRYHR